MITRELTDYIKSMRDLGETTETIRSELISAGWNINDVNDALAPVAFITPGPSVGAVGAIGSMAKTTPTVSSASSAWPTSSSTSNEAFTQKPSSGSVTRFVAEPVPSRTLPTSVSSASSATPASGVGQQIQTEIQPAAETVKSEPVLPDYRQFAEPIIKPASASIVTPATEQSFEQFAKPAVARFNGQSIPPINQPVKTISTMSSAYSSDASSAAPSSEYSGMQVPIKPATQSQAPAGQFVSSFKGGMVKGEEKPSKGGGGAVKTIIYILIILVILAVIGGGVYFASAKFGLFGMQPSQEAVPSGFEPVQMKPANTANTSAGSDTLDTSPALAEEETDDIPLSQRTTSSTTLSVTGTSTKPSTSSSASTSMAAKTVTPASASDLPAADVSAIKTSVTKLAEANKAKSVTLYKNYLSEATKKLLEDSTINWVSGFEYITSKKSGANAIVTIKVTYEGQTPASGDFVFVMESGVWKLDIGKTIELESNR